MDQLVVGSVVGQPDILLYVGSAVRERQLTDGHPPLVQGGRDDSLDTAPALELYTEACNTSQHNNRLDKLTFSFPFLLNKVFQVGAAISTK